MGGTIKMVTNKPSAQTNHVVPISHIAVRKPLVVIRLSCNFFGVHASDMKVFMLVFALVNNLINSLFVIYCYKLCRIGQWTSFFSLFS